MSGKDFKCRGRHAELDSTSLLSNLFNTKTLNQVQGDSKL